MKSTIETNLLKCILVNLLLTCNIHLLEGKVTEWCSIIYAVSFQFNAQMSNNWTVPYVVRSIVNIYLRDVQLQLESSGSTLPARVIIVWQCIYMYEHFAETLTFQVVVNV